jgi:ZIP family zinc transporter
MTGSHIVQGFLGGLLAGLATGIGALGVYFVHRLSCAANDALLSAAAGIMLAATFFSLLAAIDAAVAGHASRLGGAAAVAAGVLAGAGALALIHRLLPHEHFSGEREGPSAPHLRRIWLVVLAITLHNIPEGMAVGVGFGAGAVTSGVPLAVGIGLQNIPEGLAVAAGAMLFVITSEIIPATAHEETKIATTFALLAGFLVMMTLDIALG